MIATGSDPDNVRPVKAILTRAMKRIPASYSFANQRSVFGRNSGGVELGGGGGGG